MRSTTSVAPARVTAASTAGSSSTRSRSPTPIERQRVVLEPEEVLERAREAAAPLVGREPFEIDAVDGDAAFGRLVEAAQQLHECRLPGAVLADERDHRPGAQLEVDVVEHPRVGPRIPERHVLEPDRARERRGNVAVGLDAVRGRVLLEPGEPLRGVERPPQELGLPHGDTEVARQVRAGRERERDIAGRRVQAGGDVDDGSRRTRGRTASTPRCASSALAQRSRGDLGVPRPSTRRRGARRSSRSFRRRGSPCRARPRSRGRRSAGPAARSAPRPPRSRRSTPARHDDTHTDGTANTMSRPSSGLIDISSTTVIDDAPHRSRPCRRTTRRSGSAGTPARAAVAAGRGTRAARGARCSRPNPGAVRRAPRSRSSHWSRKRIVMRPPIVRSSQPNAAAAARPAAAHITFAVSCSVTPLTRIFSHSAPNASGSHDALTVTNDDDEQPRLGAVREPHREHERAPNGRQVVVGRIPRQSHVRGRLHAPLPSIAALSSHSRCSRASSSSSSASKRDACRSNIRW